MIARTALALLLGSALSSCALFRARPPVYEPVTLPSGVVVQDVVVPEDGPRAQSGDLVTIHYEGLLTDGVVFDSSYDRGAPISFELGAGQVPAGLDQGIVDMVLMGRRRLTVPPELGYGEDGVPPRIPPGATLIFDLELLEIGEP